HCALPIRSRGVFHPSAGLHLITHRNADGPARTYSPLQLPLVYLSESARVSPRIIMIRKTLTVIAASTFALLIAASQAEAAPPNLSGEWKINLAKSDYGPIPAPEVMTRKITHADPSLAYQTYQKGAQGEITTDVKYTTD